jgi:hypothetical protein
LYEDDLCPNSSEYNTACGQKVSNVAGKTKSHGWERTDGKLNEIDLFRGRIEATSYRMNYTARIIRDIGRIHKVPLVIKVQIQTFSYPAVVVEVPSCVVRRIVRHLYASTITSLKLISLLSTQVLRAAGSTGADYAPANVASSTGKAADRKVTESWLLNSVSGM